MDVADRVPVSPPVPEPVALHYSSKIGHIVIALHHYTIRPRVVGVGPAVLYIPSFIAELLDSQKIMHRLPGDAGERHLGGEVENDDLAAFRHDQVHARGGELADNGQRPYSFPFKQEANRKWARCAYARVDC